MLLASPLPETASPHGAMEQQLMPYQAVSSLGQGPALILAPHPDDEVFGCCGAVLAHLSRGDKVQVILITNGAQTDQPAAKQIAQTRLAESRAAAKLLGYPAPDCWQLADRSLQYGEALIAKIIAAIVEHKAAIVYAPSLQEMHPDHRAVAMSAIEAVRRVGGDILLAQYEVGVAMRPNRLLDISAAATQKQAAMQLFVSQLALQRYDQHVAALNRFRTYTLPAQVSAAEAYFLTYAHELVANPLVAYASEYQRQRALDLPVIPADLPLVSIMIRSSDRATLQDALDSVAIQTYPHIELVLVNVTGRRHSPLPAECGRFPLRVISAERKLPRAEAANAALDAAGGAWLMFLDDDDWLEPNHVSKLVAAINHGKAAPVAVYSGVRCVGPDKQALPDVLDQAFDADRLWVANYLAIHGVLFARQLITAGCRFDTRFALFEDWDFWLQASRVGPFTHVPGISAAYRMGAGGSGVHESAAISASRSALLAKWVPVLGDALINILAKALSDYEADLRQLREELAGARQHGANLDRLRQQLAQAALEKDADIAALQREIAQIVSEKDGHIATLQGMHGVAETHITTLRDELTSNIAQRDQHIAHLQSALDTIVVEKEAHICNLQDQISQLQHSVAIAAAQAEQQTQLLGERQQRVNEQLATIHHQNLRLGEHEQKSAGLAQAVQAQEAAIGELQATLQRTIAEKDGHIANLQVSLQNVVVEKDGHIANLQADMAAALSAATAAHEQHIAALRLTIGEKDDHIHSLQASLAEAIALRDGHIRNLQADASRLSGLMAQQDRLLGERQQRMDEQLATIHHQNVRLAENAHGQAQQAQTLQQLQVELIAMAAERAKLADEREALLQQKVALEQDLAATHAAVAHLSHEKIRLDQQYADAVVHVRNLDHIIINHRHQHEQLIGSRSWKITRPLRWATKQGRRVRTALALAPRAASRLGGWLPLLMKVWHVWRDQGLDGVRAKARALTQGPGDLTLPPAESAPLTEYERWLVDYDTLDDAKRARVLAEINAWQDPPKISIVMPVYETPEIWLRRALDSVIGQLYPNWELCICDDASPSPRVKAILNEYVKRDPRIKVAYRKKNGHISAASNSALQLASGDFIALLDHDDELVPHALFAVVRAILARPDGDLFYSDEDKIDIHGRRFDPYFKPDWNPDLFLSYNVFSHFGVYRASLVRALRGFREGLEGSQDYDLALRAVATVGHEKVVHIPHVLYHWRVIPGSTAASHGEKPYALIAAIKAVGEYLEGQGVRASVDESAPGSGALRVRYTLPDQPPMVTIIIPTRDGYELLSQCIDSVFAKTTYPNFEILVVDNGSRDPRVLAYLDDLKAKGHLRVLRDDSPFNYSALNNKAARDARGELLCLMNNDIEVISPDWLDEMVGHALRRDIGVVGCRLWYPDDTLQHAGVILGIGGVAGHAHHKLTRAQGGYFSRAQLIQNYSAVTAACFVVRKSVFWEVDGLNEKDLSVAFNDVEFCIKVRDAGYRNLWTPFAELYHHESATRGFEDTPEKQARFAKEVGFMLHRYGDSLKFDPAYNPNLALERQDYTLAFPPRVRLVGEEQ